MDIATIIGFLAGVVFMFLSMGQPLGFDIPVMIDTYIDGPSVMITIGGAVASTLIAYPLSKILNALKGSKVIFSPPKLDPIEAIDEIIRLSNLARREGVLALDDVAAEMEDPFLQKGINLIVDATDPELVRNILETEMSYIEERHGAAQGVWNYLASQGPAWGMIGTLVGLVLLLRDMDDAAAIGPAMAIALITTLYGTVIANFIATPISEKMKGYSGEEMLIKEVMIEGMLSIQAGENPRIIEEKLKAFLSPAMRKQEAETTAEE